MNNNCELIDGEFYVLETIRFKLPQGPWWHSADLEHDTIPGTTFRTWVDDPLDDEIEVATIIIADATSDPSEPDVSQLKDISGSDLHDFLHEELVEETHSMGTEFIEWHGSKLLDTGGMSQMLVTNFAIVDQGRNRQTTQIRKRIGSKNFVIMATVDTDRDDGFDIRVIDAIFNVAEINTSDRSNKSSVN
jgi:hypothetical protein